MEKDRFIYVRTEHRKSLKEDFGASDTCVSDALNFKTNSIKARRIREKAMNVFRGVAFV